MKLVAGGIFAVGTHILEERCVMVEIAGELMGVALVEIGFQIIVPVLSLVAVKGVAAGYTHVLHIGIVGAESLVDVVEMRLPQAVPVVVGLIERSNGHNRIAVVAADGRNVGMEQFCPFGMVLCAEIQVVFAIIDIVVIALEIHAGGIEVDGYVDLSVAGTESLNLGNLFHSAFELVGAFAGGYHTLRGNEGVWIEGYADDVDNVGVIARMPRTKLSL